MSAPILVGDPVVIRRARPDAPVNREGAAGCVVDVAAVGRAFLVEFGEDDAKWYEAECVEKLTDPPREPVDFEHDGLDAHLDAIEAGLKLARSDGGAFTAGSVAVVSRAAFVPSVRG